MGGGLEFPWNPGSPNSPPRSGGLPWRLGRAWLWLSARTDPTKRRRRLRRRCRGSGKGSVAVAMPRPLHREQGCIFGVASVVLGDEQEVVSVVGPFEDEQGLLVKARGHSRAASQSSRAEAELGGVPRPR